MCIQNNAPIRSNLDVQQHTTGELPQTEGQLGGKNIAVEIPNLRVEGGDDVPQQATSLAARRVGPLPTSSEFRQELGIARFSLQAFRDTDTRAILKDLDRFHQLTSGMRVLTGEQAFEKLNVQMTQVGQAFTALDHHLDRAILNKSGDMQEALIAMKAQVAAQRDDYLKVFQSVAQSDPMAQPSKASLSTIASMVSAGFTLDQARQLADKGVSSTAAGAFLQAGLGFKEALEFGAGLRNPEAFVSTIRIAGVQSAAPTTLPKFIRLSNDAKYADVLKRIDASGIRNLGNYSLNGIEGFDPKIASAYCDAGVTNPKMMELLFDTSSKLVRVTPEAVRAFKTVGITDTHVMKQLANNGYSAKNLGELGEYARMGIGPSDRQGVPGAQELIDAKVPMDLVKAATSMEETRFFPLSAKEILAAHQAGFTPEQIAEYRPFSESAHKPQWMSSGDFNVSTNTRTLSIDQAAAAFKKAVPLALAFYAMKSLEFDIDTTAKVLQEAKGDIKIARGRLQELRFDNDLGRMNIQEKNISCSDKDVLASKHFGAGAMNQVRLVEFRDGSKGIFKAEPISGLTAGYVQVLGTGANDGKQSARNMVTDVVGAFLNTPVAAKSQYAVIDHRVGLVMELAPGSGIGSANTKTMTTNERGQMRKQLVDLQILDILTAQMDRHSKNINIDVKDGVVQVRGFDHDGSFGTEVTDIGKFLESENEKGQNTKDYRTTFSGTYCKGYPPMIDQEQYDKVMNIDPQKFEEALSLQVGDSEARAARLRLEGFQNHLENGNVTVLLKSDNDENYTDAWGRQDLTQTGFTTKNCYLAYAEKL